MEYVVGLGECVISSNPEDILKTFALSTCVGITVYCPEKKILAMAHIVLPDSTNFESERGFNVMKFADTAVPTLFQRLGYEYGCTDKEKMTVRIFGGITSGKKDSFRIGDRNLDLVRTELERLKLFFDDRETGGNVSRTLVARVDFGNVEIIKRPLQSLIKDSSAYF